MSEDSLSEMIHDWNQMTYQGRYFEIFAIVADGQVVGLVSLYQHGKSIISAGPEIFSPYRKRGYAFQGVTLALEESKSKGYKVAVAQVRKNNDASIALHNKLGFMTDHWFVNSKGNEVWFMMKVL